MESISPERLVDHCAMYRHGGSHHNCSGSGLKSQETRRSTGRLHIWLAAHGLWPFLRRCGHLNRAAREICSLKGKVTIMEPLWTTYVLW